MGSACEKQIGYVIFDSVCLMLGAAELRAGVTAEAAEEMAEACKPVISKFDSYILTIANKASSTTEVASAVFGIMSTIWSGGCLGSVGSAWLGDPLSRQCNSLLEPLHSALLSLLSILMVPLKSVLLL